MSPTDTRSAITRRELLAAIAAGAAPLAFGSPALARMISQAPRRLAIDGLGEIHVDYPPQLLDEIRASGMRACVITLGNPALQGPSAYEDTISELAQYEEHIRRNPDRLSNATRVADIDAAVARGTIALIYYLQNSTPIGDSLDAVADLHRRGVRIMQLTYNTRNLVGDGCLERTNSGLSRFGVDLVARMNEVGMLVDLSHCGEATTLEGIAFSKKPAAITHAGCKAAFDHPRNKTDEALKALAAKGGVIGIYQINPYLGGKERNTLADYLAHVDHAVKVAGEDHVAIGSDREHRIIPDAEEEMQKLIAELSRLRPVTAATVRWPFFIRELNHPRRMETVADGLSRRGYTARRIDKIIGGNWYRLLKETIG